VPTRRNRAPQWGRVHVWWQPSLGVPSTKVLPRGGHGEVQLVRWISRVLRVPSVQRMRLPLCILTRPITVALTAALVTPSASITADIITTAPHAAATPNSADDSTTTITTASNDAAASCPPPAISTATTSTAAATTTTAAAAASAASAAVVTAQSPAAVFTAQPWAAAVAATDSARTPQS